MKDNVYFVSGIDTDAGKSYVTGYLAARWNREGIRTITQKFIQTGNREYSEDIDLHRRIMGTGLLEEDRAGLTAPQIFTYPCSPHLASEIDGRAIDFDLIGKATETLSERFDRVLLEGAGGLMVPLTRTMLTIDYITRMDYPLIFVTSGRLGSINHTLLSLEAIKARGIRLAYMVYNMYPKEEDTTISDDTRLYFKDCLATEFPDAGYLEVPVLSLPF